MYNLCVGDIYTILYIHAGREASATRAKPIDRLDMHQLSRLAASVAIKLTTVILSGTSFIIDAKDVYN